MERKEPSIHNISDEDFEEYIVKPYEREHRVERIMEVEEQEDTERILTTLSRKELIELALDAQEYYGKSFNPLVSLIMDELGEREIARLKKEKNG